VEREIAWAAAALLSALGLSQVYAWSWWVAYHQRLAERGPAAVRGYGTLVLSGGAIIALFHNVWSGAGTVLTIAGWLFVVEGVLCVFAPNIGMMGLSAADPALRRRTIIASGTLALIVAGVLWADLLL
jgi:hypothetical protein